MNKYLVEDAGKESSHHWRREIKCKTADAGFEGVHVPCTYNVVVCIYV